MAQIAELKGVPVDFISVTKGAGGSLRGGTLPIAQMIKSRFEICSLAHFTCRDYTTDEIENNLMDHHYFGVNNILALRGDPPDGQPDHFKPSPDRHSYAYQLVEQIRQLNEGTYLTREGFDKAGTPRKGTPTTFCIGVAAHPEAEPFGDAVDHLRRKVDAGARFAITQMLFETAPYERYIEELARRGSTVPVIPDIRIVTQAATAQRMKLKFGVNVPASLVDKLERSASKESARETGFEFTRVLCEKLLAAGAPGLHVFVMNDAISGARLLKLFQ
jgi:methylenetetrahydrofolate reductase (NADPH)